MRRSLLTLGAALGALVVSSAASATTYFVDAYANSSSGGAGLVTISVTAGDAFSVSVDPGDLWAAGGGLRWSNANGLGYDPLHPLLATGTDDSGELAGTPIGGSFGTYTQGNLTAPYGTLVGAINGDFRVLGTSFSGTAWDTGDLLLYYWDSNFGDNKEGVDVTVNQITPEPSAVPEPATWALMMAGFAVVGFGLRRRTAAATKVSYTFA